MKLILTIKGEITEPTNAALTVLHTCKDCGLKTMSFFGDSYVCGRMDAAEVCDDDFCSFWEPEREANDGK